LRATPGIPPAPAQRDHGERAADDRKQAAEPHARFSTGRIGRRAHGAAANEAELAALAVARGDSPNAAACGLPMPLLKYRARPLRSRFAAASCPIPAAEQWRQLGRLSRPIPSVEHATVRFPLGPSNGQRQVEPSSA